MGDDVAPPAAPGAEDERYLTLVSSTQREINRLSDEDRNTRKRGLQKLLDELPWSGKGGSGTKKALKLFVTSILLPAVLGVTIETGKNAEEGGNEGLVQAAFSYRGGTGTLLDSVEKCRELSLTMVKKCLENVSTLSSNAYIAIIQILCKRITANVGEATGSFPEVAEELRLQVLDNLLLALNMSHAQYERVQKKKSDAEKGYEVPPFETSKYKPAIESLIGCLPRALSDGFPQSKRSASELICRLGELSPYLTRLHFRPLARGIATNCAHQHSKTRSLSLKALASILGNVTEDFEAVMGKMQAAAGGAVEGGAGAGERSVAEDYYGMGGTEGALTPSSAGKGPTAAKKIDLSVLLQKLLADQNANVRRELCHLCSRVMKVRYSRYPLQRGAYVTSRGELELCLLLLLLCGDDVAEVREAAYSALESGAKAWAPSLRALPDPAAGMLGVAQKEVFAFSHTPPEKDSAAAVEDAEASLRQLSLGSKEATGEGEGGAGTRAGTGAQQGYLASCRFVACHVNGLIRPLCRGVTDWTAESRLRYLHGLHNTLILAGPEACSQVAELCLHALGPPCRDDEPSVRQAAERCCSVLASVVSSPSSSVGDGSAIAAEALLGYLLPRVAGVAVGKGASSSDTKDKISGSTSGGGDTASQRGNAVRVLTHVVLGLPYRYQEGYSGTLPIGKGKGEGTEQDEAQAQSQAPFERPTAVPLRVSKVDAGSAEVLERYSSLVAQLARTLARPELHEFREEWLREAILLLIRALIDTYPSLCAGPTSAEAERDLLLALLYLMGRLPGEPDLVPSVAAQEMARLCSLSGGTGGDGEREGGPSPEAKIKAVFSLHFSSLLQALLEHSAAGSAGGEDRDRDRGESAYNGLKWDNDDVSKAAFDNLVRTCPSEAWKHQEQILSVIVPQVQLPALVTDEKDPEVIAATYKAIAGDTNAFEAKDEANVRLTLMALLEAWVRAGNMDWTVSKHLNAAAPVILKDVICRNLVWRVGRVEATVRKVTLATTHALLRAGSVPPQTLYACAAELVPLLCSQLDDNEASMRHMASLSISVVFDRLKGAFGPQAVSEMYPMLVKRFDDSNDDVRQCCIRAMGTFMSASLPGAFSGTSLDYTLDQLFVHLDDSNEKIQDACHEAIMVAARLPGSPGAGACSSCGELVTKKARDQRGSHRSPGRCDAILKELR